MKSKKLSKKEQKEDVFITIGRLQYLFAENNRAVLLLKKVADHISDITIALNRYQKQDFWDEKLSIAENFN